LHQEKTKYQSNELVQLQRMQSDNTCWDILDLHKFLVNVISYHSLIFWWRTETMQMFVKKTYILYMPTTNDNINWSVMFQWILKAVKPKEYQKIWVVNFESHDHFGMQLWCKLRDISFPICNTRKAQCKVLSLNANNAIFHYNFIYQLRWTASCSG
jgi:hypothetical protein